MSISLEDLVKSSREERMRDKDVRERGLVKVFRGYYIPEALLEPTAPPWVTQRALSQARILARIDSLGTDNPGAATMESALIMWGLNTWAANPDVHFRRPRNVGAPPRSLPSAKVLGRDFPHATAFEMTSERRLPLPFSDENPTASLMHPIGGIHTVGLGEAALDLARSAHPLVAYFGVSNVLRHVARYNPWRLEESLARVALIRSTMLEGVTSSPVRGLERSIAVLSAADPGVSSPGEALILWMLHDLLRADHSSEAQFESQYDVIANGNQYFLDVAFPQIGLGLEFDGLGKLRLEGAETDFRRRHADLTRSGWTLRHYPSEDSGDPLALARTVARDLTSAGLKPQGLGGPLWEPIPKKLLIAGRSNGTVSY